MTLNPGAESGLKGQLEDLPLIDMLQIVAFSKKTGYLRIDGPRGRGGIVFHDGLVVCAYSWSTLKYLRQLGEDLQGAHNVPLLRKQIEISLRELAGLKEGAFHFQVTESIPSELEGMPVASFVIERGINPEGLLLELAKDFDEERHEASQLLESPGSAQHHASPASEADSATSTSNEDKVPARNEAPEDVESEETPVLLVDDEQPVRDILSRVLRDYGYRIYVATGPAEAIGIASEIAMSKKRFLVVTDLSMPTTTGRSFRGGLELARAIKKNGYNAPVLLMAEKLSPKVRSRAKSFGIRRIALKPALSKLDRDAYENDLREFGAAIIRLLKDLETTETIEDESESVQPVAEDKATTPFLDYIASMTEHLLDPKRSVDVSQLVLQVASKYLERGVLFLIKEQRACGIGGFGFVATKQASVEVAQTISFNIDQAPPFGEVSYSGRTERFSAELDCFQSCLYSVIGKARATECILIPMLNNSEVLVILFGDNAASGRPIGKLRGLELFIGQAGVTLENTYLHSKLRAFEAKLARIERATP